MKKINITDFQRNMVKYFDNVVDQSRRLTVTRQHKPNIVIISEKDYECLKENLYVLGNSTNRKHLDRSINQAKNHQTTQIHLNDL
ncbi:type II toxin-antitoxin system Phd/YefM family antitoxin [Lentilactobacillus sunkii]|uniref:type II toxin-antitoxin system Phd/YefM family antitoxin n=1 Tax=Lentilactobacillus sunkii TaxID=481719 RepID=UPI0039C88A50